MVAELVEVLRAVSFFIIMRSHNHAVPELVESLSEPSAESSLLELSRGEAKDIKGPSLSYAEAQPKIFKGSEFTQRS